MMCQPFEVGLAPPSHDKPLIRDFKADVHKVRFDGQK